MKGRKHNEPRHNEKKGSIYKDPPPTDNDSDGSSNVLKEARARKAGGRIQGKMSAMNLGRPGRKRGGRCGADMSPLSSAGKPA